VLPASEEPPPEEPPLDEPPSEEPPPDEPPPDEPPPEPALALTDAPEFEDTDTLVAAALELTGVALADVWAAICLACPAAGVVRRRRTARWA
jgi:hypothetical protein